MKGFAAVLLALAAFSVDGFIGRRAHMVEQRHVEAAAAQVVGTAAVEQLTASCAELAQGSTQPARLSVRLRARSSLVLTP